MNGSPVNATKRTHQVLQRLFQVKTKNGKLLKFGDQKYSYHQDPLILSNSLFFHRKTCRLLQQ